MRVQNWQVLLYEFVKEPTFQWGQNDCILWCARWASLLTGEDFIKNFDEGVVGSYDTEAEAYRLLKEKGFKDVGELASHYLDEVPLSLAQRGDWVLDPNNCMGICLGRESIFLTEAGTMTRPTKTCIKAWRID